MVSAEESKALNADTTPKVIIASGGMCEGGRIRHHLKHNLWNEKNTVMFAGYQAAGTLGRIIYDGAKQVKILGETIEVKAEVTLLDGISGHADKDGLLDWISKFEKKPSMVFVNHGDDESCAAFARAVTDTFGIPAAAPYSGSTYDLAAGEWVRLMDPVYKKETKKKAGEKAPKQENLYHQLLQEAAALNEKIRGMEGHSNAEIKKLISRIRDLIQS